MATVQFSVLPSFAHLVLPDASPVVDAVSYVLHSLRKPVEPEAAASAAVVATPAVPSAATLSAAISAQTGAQTIADLVRSR